MLGAMVCTDLRSVEIVAPTTLMLVAVSMSLPLLKSTRRLNWCRKSAPMIAYFVSAITNDHTKDLLSPRLVVRVFEPYVSIAVLFAAYNLKPVRWQRRVLRGMMDTSEPVSMRKLNLVVGSNTMSRRLRVSASWAASSDAGVSFPGWLVHPCWL